MDSAGPWWATPLFTLAGVLLTLFTTSRQQSRFRWTAERRSAYAGFLIACKQLRDITVWPEEPSAGPVDTAPVVALIRDRAEHTALVGSRRVAGHVDEATVAARRLAAAVEHIRRTSKPGHHGALDERRRADFDEATDALTGALDQLLDAARSDLGAGRSLRRRRRTQDPATADAGPDR